MEYGMRNVFFSQNGTTTDLNKARVVYVALRILIGVFLAVVHAAIKYIFIYQPCVEIYGNVDHSGTDLKLLNSKHALD